ncbi:MAG: DNA-binding protein, partial [Bacteroidetes bacterium]
FLQLIKQISIMNKHIVFVAHRETKTEGDDTRYVPLFGGSNYDSLVTELDLVGYMEANGQQRTITFNPTSRNDGKNTCNLPDVMNIPTIIDQDGNPIAENDFLTKQVIEPYYNRLKERTAQGEKYKKLMADIDENIMLITDVTSLNDCKDRISKWEHIGNSKIVAGNKLNEKAKELNLTFNKESKQYESAV